MHSYAAMTPDALDALDPEERHHIHKLLKLKVLVSADGSLQISGALANCFAPENKDRRLVRRKGMGDLVDAVERLARSGDSSHTLVPDPPSDQKNT